VLIDLNIEAKLRKHLVRDFSIESPLTFQRLATTEEQRRLSPADQAPQTGRQASTEGRRHRRSGGDAAHILRQLLRKRIESFLDGSAHVIRDMQLDGGKSASAIDLVRETD
jgi:hypothetical protein